MKTIALAGITVTVVAVVLVFMFMRNPGKEPGSVDFGIYDESLVEDLVSPESEQLSEEEVLEMEAPTVTAMPTATVTPTVKTPTAISSAAAAVWQPAPGTSWQWQLSDLPIDQSLKVEMYDIDLFDNEAGTVSALVAQGSKVVCYVSVGSWEEWRADARQFPSSVIGKDYSGWAGERWLDVRQIDLLAPVMQGRLDECKAKGFDGVEPDNIDGYTNDTGFPLTYADQLAYNIWLANEAHARGLSIGLKNNPEQVADLLPYFDWALTEDCFAQGWCDSMTPFIKAGKAVFAAEYTDTGITTRDFCVQAVDMRFSALLKHRNLDAYFEQCPSTVRSE